MRSVTEAIDALCALARTVQATETVPLSKAHTRVLAESVVSRQHVPPADNSAMDGYALRASDWSGESAIMPVSQRIAAGQAPQPLLAGTAARIFTGAEIPDGADCVVMQEHCEVIEKGVQVAKRPGPGDNIRLQGQDIRHGQEVLAAGRYLRPQDLGLLASMGMKEVGVRRRLRVAVVSNGDELVEPGTPLGPGQIYNSNRYLLTALLNGWNFQVVDLGIAADDPVELEGIFRQGAKEADVILSTGGVSVGEEDHVKAVLEQMGSLELWKIAMKPGKPLAFGHIGDTAFMGLPGNPASALVTALIVARPFLFQCQGRTDGKVMPTAVQAGFDKPAVTRQEYLRVRLGAGVLERHKNQSSGVLLSASWGDGLAIQMPGQDIVAGEAMDYLPFSSML